MQPENPSNRRFFQPEVKLCDLCTLKNVPLPNIPGHFLTPCSKSLLSATANDLKIDTRLGSEVKFLLTEGGTGDVNQALLQLKRTGDTASVLVTHFLGFYLTDLVYTKTIVTVSSCT